jgi:hypothetical protein
LSLIRLKLNRTGLVSMLVGLPLSFVYGHLCLVGVEGVRWDSGGSEPVGE